MRIQEQLQQRQQEHQTKSLEKKRQEKSLLFTNYLEPVQSL